MEVKIYVDIACPFCYIGKKNLEEALSNFKTDEEIHLNYLSYELDNQRAKEPKDNIYDYLAEKNEQPIEEIHDMVDRIVAEGQKVNIEFNMDKVIPANTRDAHRLLKLAKEKGKGEEILELLYQAYFSQGNNISDHQVLEDLALSGGLEKEDVRELLEDPSINLEEVIGDFNLAKVNKIKTLPYYIFDDTFAIAGAREAKHYTIALNKTLKNK